MLTTDIDRLLDEWAIAWSSSANTDPDRVLALFADDGMYEDVTSGAVVRGKDDLRRYLVGAFATIPRLHVWRAAPVCRRLLGRCRVDHVGH
jgi:uncharacterized protein (TIGR02246 family)